MPMQKNIYPPHWRQIRLRLLARDKYRCTVCGVEDRRHIIRVGECYVYMDGPNAGYKYNNEGKFIEYVQDYQSLSGKVIQVVITIMHLDHDEWNHEVSDDRLACVCQLHHLKYDRHDNELRKRYGKHFKRFQLSLFNIH